MAGLVSRVCPGGPNTVQWTVWGDHNFGGTVDSMALSSTLAALGMLQPRAFGSLNRVDPSDSVSNYYLDSSCHKLIG